MKKPKHAAVLEAVAYEGGEEAGASFAAPGAEEFFVDAPACECEWCEDAACGCPACREAALQAEGDRREAASWPRWADPSLFGR